MPMYKVVQTGANAKFGGRQDGLFRVYIKILFCLKYIISFKKQKWLVTSYHPLIFLRTNIPPINPPINGDTVNVIGIQGTVILDF